MTTHERGELSVATLRSRDQSHYRASAWREEDEGEMIGWWWLEEEKCLTCYETVEPK
jgi:hypothetical protein